MHQWTIITLNLTSAYSMIIHLSHHSSLPSFHLPRIQNWLFLWSEVTIPSSTSTCSELEESKHPPELIRKAFCGRGNHQTISDQSGFRKAELTALNTDNSDRHEITFTSNVHMVINFSHDRPSMYCTPVHRTVQQYTVHSTQVQSKGWQPKS